MLRVAIVAALVALALPAGAIPAVPGLPVAAEPVDDALPPMRLGNPLWSAEPAVAVPLILEVGYAEAARQLRAADQPEPEPSEAAEEDEEPLTFHDLGPLGDANGNGRDDVILWSYVEDADNATMQALDGGRLSEVLWSLELTEDDYAYLVGDVDEDGVYDLEKLVDESSGETPDGYQASATIQLLSGRDLSILGTLTIEAHESYEETDPGLVPMGPSTYRETYSYQYLSDLEDLSGLARITWEFEYSEGEDGVGPIRTSGYSYYNDSRTYALLTVAGDQVWAFDESGWDLHFDDADATGDGIPDVVVRRSDSFSASGGGFELPFADLPETPVPLPLVSNSQPPRVPFEVRVLDGADGTQLWSKQFGNSTFSYTSWYGNLYGSGPVLYVYIVDFESFDFFERSLLLDGKTGELLREVTDGRNLLDLGDADQDGDGDLLALDYSDDVLSLEGLTGTFDPLWTLKVAGDEYAGILDFTGDGVLDVLRRYGDNFTVMSGRDGNEAWSREQGDLVDSDLAPGILDEDDVELGFLLSDAGEDGDMSNVTADLLLVRGSDGAALWQKQVYDPRDYETVAADDAALALYEAGDINGDGANDFVMSLYQGYSIHTSTVCNNGDCETTVEDSRDDDVGQPLNVIALIDGASGASYLRFDDMRLAPKVEVVQEQAVDIKPAGEELVEEDVPGLAFYAALVAIGVAVVLNRRKA